MKTHALVHTLLAFGAMSCGRSTTSNGASEPPATRDSSDLVVSTTGNVPTAAPEGHDAVWGLKPGVPRSDTRLEEPIMTTPITDAARVLAGLRPRIRKCHQQALETEPKMSGKLTIMVKVAPNGDVASAEAVSSTGVSPAVVQCSTDALKRPQFTAPGGNGSTMTVPVVFAIQAE
jgi:hypothetical protein